MHSATVEFNKKIFQFRFQHAIIPYRFYQIRRKLFFQQQRSPVWSSAFILLYTQQEFNQ